MGRRSRSSGASAEGSGVSPKRSRHRYNTRLSLRAKRDAKLGGEQAGRRGILSDEKFREMNTILKEETIGKPLIVKELDTLREDNRRNHHTEEFEDQDLIVRRGQEFSLALTFDREVNKEKDVIVLQFSFGERPQESKGTLIRLPVDFEKSGSIKDGWTVTKTDVSEKKLTVTVMTEADANIGKYTLYVETKAKGDEKDFSRAECDETLYVLFNPWCEDDIVFMEKERERVEYVLNETGRIWVGSARSNWGKPWVFGQFETPVLKVVLHLLDKGELGDAARNSPASIIRCLSALVNSMDDEGLLEGRWDGDYPSDTTRPTAWMGSVPIIEEYNKTKKPVQFGQCWVFSGVTTTLLRCLGIPTRSVTNFESAHDTDCSMTIDKHYDIDGTPLEDLNDDSVWNFHVWNESYFQRRDLPDGYDGWQAHDGTPQETTDGVYQCGPAPVTAVKKGHVYLNFETGFIFSEVNGDRINWMRYEDGHYEIMYVESKSIGKCISTKAVGSDFRHDLTNDYKYEEGSPEERKAVQFVERFSTNRTKRLMKTVDLTRPSEAGLELIVPTKECIGDDLEVGVKVTNKTSGKLTMKVKLTFASTFYTGVVGQAVQDEVIEKALEGKASDDFTMSVSAKHYESVMNSEAKFKLTATCRVIETNNMYVETDSFELSKANLEFKIPENVPLRTDLTIQVSFKNTTDLKLHNGVINVSGSYLVKDKTKVYKVGKILHPGDEFTADVAVYAWRKGERKIAATFSSDELSDCFGESPVHVTDKEEDKEMETN